MSVDLDQVLERVRQNATARAAAASPVGNVDRLRARVSGGPFLAGDRVFDRVTGSEGIVEPSPRLASDGMPLVVVRLDRGGLVKRPADQLVARPTPPQPTPEAR